METTDERIEQLANDYSRAELIAALNQQVSRPGFISEGVQTDGTYVIPDAPDIRIEELDFSQRTYNCLRRGGIRDLPTIIQCHLNDFTGIRCLGKVSLAEIVNAVTKYGFQLHPVHRCELARKIRDWVEENFSPDDLRYVYLDNIYAVNYHRVLYLLEKCGQADAVQFLASLGFTK